RHERGGEPAGDEHEHERRAATNCCRERRNGEEPRRLPRHEAVVAVDEQREQSATASQPVWVHAGDGGLAADEVVTDGVWRQSAVEEVMPDGERGGVRGEPRQQRDAVL